MIRKQAGYYTEEATSHSTNDQLNIEISNCEISLLVTSTPSAGIAAFELFEINPGNILWSDLFIELENQSRILHQRYHTVHCWYHFEESVIIPEKKFSISAAEDYLSLIYGESSLHEMKYETLADELQMVNAYRVKREIHNWILQKFILFHPHHIYTPVLNRELMKESGTEFRACLRIYTKHCILTIIKQGKLQLIQTFNYQLQEDIVYHLLNAMHQLGMDKENTCLELLGRIDPDSSLFEQLTALFAHAGIETTGVTEKAFAETGFPEHYFLPFYSSVS